MHTNAEPARSAVILEIKKKRSQVTAQLVSSPPPSSQKMSAPLRTVRGRLDSSLSRWVQKRMILQNIYPRYVVTIHKGIKKALNIKHELSPELLGNLEACNYIALR